MRIFRAALLIAGTALCVLLFWGVGLDATMSVFAGLSWRLPLLLLFPACLMVACDTLGWRFAFRRARVPFGALFRARLAGEAINLTTPTASVGGEPLKTWLIRAHAPLSESLSSVVVAKTTITIAEALFLLVGVLVASSILQGDSGILRGMQWLLVLECLGTGGFVALQALGGLGKVGRALRRLGILDAPHRQAALGAIDQEIAQFYRREPRRLGLSVFWHLGGWFTGVLETYLILWALDRPVSLGLAMVVDAFGTGVRFAAFLVPARVGAQEAGDVAIFIALGLGAPLGLAFSVVRRLRELLWAALGYVAFAMQRQRPDRLPSVAPSPEPEA